MKLSKSQYIRALQCPKMLWMDKFMPDKAVCNDNLEGIFETGNEVGNLARSYFGEYALVDFSFDKKQMIEDTEKYTYSGAKNIAEASFLWDDLFCSVDILHKNPYGWDIIEVKSSTHTTPVYIEDMAFQYYVLKKSGLSITGIYNMHLNSEYVRRGRLELGRLFSIEDCTDIVLSKQEYVRTNIDNIRKFMAVADDMEPETILGLHCDKPYNCAYTDYCRRNLPHPNVFDIRSNMKGKRKYDLFDSGIVSFEDVIKSGARLSVNQQLQVEAEYYEKPPKINKKKIKECLDEFSYPLYFLDFETFQPAIPKFDGTKPYMQIPFQYSLHIQDCKGAEPEHREFLAKEGTDPRRSLAEKLCEDIPRDVCTLAYNMKFEKMIIKSLAEEFADLAPHLMNIYENIKDLMVPFEKKYYYDRAFEGSYSIKYVLPAMCPNDPELNYHNLDGIHNGGEAMAAFDGLEKRSPEEVAQIRKNLLAYCRLDTLAMVKILEKLDDIC